MLIRVLDNREVEIIYEESEGSQNENRITTFNLEVPQDYSEFIKKIVFITEDGNFFDYIENDTYILKNNITKYKKVKSYIWLTNATTNQDFRSKLFDLSFNYNENPSDYVPSEQEQSQWDLMVEELEELIEEVQALPTLKREIVEELPTEDIDPDTIYMVLRSNTEPNNVYDEYMYIEDEWEKIGSTDVDLSQYAKKEDLEDVKDQVEAIETDLYGEVEYNVTTGEKTINGTKEDRDLSIPKIYGNSTQEGTPTPSTPIPIKSVTGNNNVVVSGKNLFNKNAVTSGALTSNGTINNDTGFFTSDFIEASSTMIMSWANQITDGNVRVGWYDSSKTFVSRTMTAMAHANVRKFVIDNSANNYPYIRISIAVNNLDSLQVENGSTESSYEPYVTPQTKPLNLGTIELNKIGTYQDYIYKNNNKWYKKENVGKYTFTGNEGFNEQTSGVKFTQISWGNLGITNFTAIAGLSQKFGWNVITTTTSDLGFYFTSGYVRFRPSLSYTSQEFLSIITGTIIYYAKSIATDIELTDTTLISQLEDIQKLKQYNDTTIITIDDIKEFDILLDGSKIEKITDDIGDTSQLTTTVKTDLVAAVNEVNSAIGDIGELLDTLNGTEV